MDKWDKAHMEAAEVYGSLSHAKRLKVGCVIVRDNRIISIGYNGTPSGWDNNCERRKPSAMNKPTLDYWTDLETKPEVLHAETNAITKLAKSSESAEGATLYCTYNPCFECAKLIYQSGITRVVYKNNYRDDAGIKFLEKAGCWVEKYDNT